MLSYRERVTIALEVLTREVYPYLEESLRKIYRDRWLDAAEESFRKDRSLTRNSDKTPRWDAQAILTVMWDQWNSVFRHKLGHTERSMVSELREFRNRWAHQMDFDFDDTFRVLDSVQRLIRAIAPDAEKEIAFQKRELLREEFGNEVRQATEKARMFWKMWRNITTYAICAIALIFTLFQTFGADNGATWWAVICVVLIFSYFTYEVVSFQPVLFGPHECVRCHRIIYREPCPYCHPQPEIPPLEQAEDDEDDSISDDSINELVAVK